MERPLSRQASKSQGSQCRSAGRSVFISCSWRVTVYVETTTRVIFAASWRGLSATTIWMVEQLGFAMMPLCFQMSCGLTSGTTRGVAGSIRQALELSTTIAPFWAKSGEYCLEIPEPALILGAGVVGVLIHGVVA